MGALDNTGASFTLNAQTGSWNMLAASITGGTLNFADGHTLTFDRPDSSLQVSQFLGVTINGDLAVRGTPVLSTDVYFDRETVINGTLTIGRRGNVGLQPGRDWSTPIVFDGGSLTRLVASQPGQITFTPGMLIRGTGGTIDFIQDASCLNRGTIRCDVPSESFVIRGQFINEGLVEGRNGGRLSISTDNQQTWTNTASGVISVDPGGGLQMAGNWHNYGLIAINDIDATLSFLPERTSRNYGLIEATNSRVTFNWGFRNSGTVRVINSDVDFNGQLRTTDLVGFERTGGTVRLVSGVLDNTDQVFHQNPQTGPWILGTNGVIRGGIIDQTGGVRLQFGQDFNTGILDGVTVRGDLLVNGGVEIDNSLTMESGVVRISHGSYFRVSGGVTLDNMTGEFDDNDFSNPRATFAVLNSPNSPVVLGPGFYAHGGLGRFGQNLGSANDAGLINRGTITADRAVRAILRRHASGLERRSELSDFLCRARG